MPVELYNVFFFIVIFCQQTGFIILAVIRLEDLLSKVGLVELGNVAIATIGKSHPVERCHVVCLCSFDELIDELEHVFGTEIVVGLSRAGIDIRGPPFTENHGRVIALHEIGFHVGNHVVNLADDFFYWT